MGYSLKIILKNRDFVEGNWAKCAVNGQICPIVRKMRDCQSPFEENVIKKMQHFAYSLIPLIVASGVIGGIGNQIMTAGKSLEISLDLGMVQVVVVVFLLVYIFKYGAVLQQESDETL